MPLVALRARQRAAPGLVSQQLVGELWVDGLELLRRWRPLLGHRRRPHLGHRVQPLLGHRVQPLLRRREQPLASAELIEGSRLAAEVLLEGRVRLKLALRLHCVVARLGRRTFALNLLQVLVVLDLSKRRSVSSSRGTRRSTAPTRTQYITTRTRHARLLLVGRGLRSAAALLGRLVGLLEEDLEVLVVAVALHLSK